MWISPLKMVMNAICHGAFLWLSVRLAVPCEGIIQRPWGTPMTSWNPPKFKNNGNKKGILPLINVNICIKIMIIFIGVLMKATIIQYHVNLFDVLDMAIDKYA